MDFLPNGTSGKAMYSEVAAPGRILMMDGIYGWLTVQLNLTAVFLSEMV
jgi:hypothetical protein